MNQNLTQLHYNFLSKLCTFMYSALKGYHIYQILKYLLIKKYPHGHLLYSGTPSSGTLDGNMECNNPPRMYTTFPSYLYNGSRRLFVPQCLRPQRTTLKHRNYGRHRSYPWWRLHDGFALQLHSP